MTMLDDQELIRQYAHERSEAAFAELVKRHLPLVHSTALRLTAGDATMTADVAQIVFTDLAKKAAKLSRHRSIVAWLHTSTRFAAANAVRSETRRRAREQTAFAMNEIHAETQPAWSDLQPVIDEALSELSDDDREAVLLRFFAVHTFSTVGATLGISENAARMRVDRALEKLRVTLQKRGLAATTLGLTAALAGAVAGTASAQLALAITSAALATTTGASVFSVPAFLKMTLAVSAALIVAVATILHFGKNSKPPSDKTTTASSANHATTSILSLEEKARILNPKADPNAYQKLLERHDRSVRLKNETGWEKSENAFHDWLHDDPGVRRLGGSVQTNLASGETVVTGGWLTPSGKRIFALVTPHFKPDSTTSQQIELLGRWIEINEKDLENLHLTSLRANGAESSSMLKWSEASTAVMIRAIEQQGAGILGAPKVSTGTDMRSAVSMLEQKMIEGKSQEMGSHFELYPLLAPDGKSVNLRVIARIALDAVPSAPDLESKP